jgi:hypothetical protein
MHRRVAKLKGILFINDRAYHNPLSGEMPVLFKNGVPAAKVMQCK